MAVCYLLANILFSYLSTQEKFLSQVVVCSSGPAWTQAYCQRTELSDTGMDSADVRVLRQLRHQEMTHPLLLL